MNMAICCYYGYMLVLWLYAGIMVICWYYGYMLVLWLYAGIMAICWYYGYMLVLWLYVGIMVIDMIVLIMNVHVKVCMYYFII